jgi:hypothetical protein
MTGGGALVPSHSKEGSMLPQNEVVMIQMHKDAYNSAYQEAEKLRMLRQAGLLQSGSLYRLVCRGAVVLGRLLVTVGRRLERLERVVTPA